MKSKYSFRTPVGMKVNLQERKQKTPLYLSVPRPAPREVIKANILPMERRALFADPKPPKVNALQDQKWITDEHFSDPVLLGSGTYGVVYQATDNRSKEKVAIKLIYVPVDSLDEVIRELYVAGVVARKNPTYLASSIRMIVLPSQSKFPYMRRLMIVLPLAYPDLDDPDPKNGSLAANLSLLQNLSDETFAEMILRMFCGLKVLHDSGFVHNDLKPENILFYPDGPKLADFGLVTLSNSVFRRSSPYLMTESYRPPEYFCIGKNNIELWPNAVSPKGDMWSMGILILELILYKFYPELGKRIWEGSWFKTDWKKRMSKLSLVKGQNVDFVNTCLLDPKLQIRTIEKLPSAQDALSILNALFDQKIVLDPHSSKTETVLLNLASHLLQMNPANRWNTNQAIEYLVNSLKLEPCEPAIQTRLPSGQMSPPIDSTGKELLKALAIALHVTNLKQILSTYQKLSSESVSKLSKQIDQQMDDIAKTYVQLVSNLHLEGKDPAKEKARRGAFALAVLLHWGGLFAPYFLSHYQYWEFISLLDLQNELMDLLTQLDLHPTVLV